MPIPVFCSIATKGPRTGIEAGKSLADMAGEHNVDAPTLKNMILENYRAQLDDAVRDGYLTQAEADAQYDRFAPEVEEIISSTGRRVNKDQPLIPAGR